VTEYSITGLTSDLPYEFRLCGTDGISTSEGVSVGSYAFKIGGTCDSQSSATTCGQVAGTGLSSDPYILCTAAQLNNLSTCGVDKHFKLGSDIDMNAVSYTIPANFSGSFDGDGYTIYNLSITQTTTDNIGMFANTSSGAVIKNLTLQSASITGRNKVGAIAGSTSGTSIENITVYGSVSGVGQVGGIVGYNSASDTKFIDSHVSVTGTGDKVGGILGEHLAGRIEYSYADGAIIGNDYVGGLVGSVSVSGDIRKSYSRSSITATGSNKGAIDGANSSIIPPSDTYFDNSVMATSVSGTGKTTDELSLINTFTNWDFMNWLVPDFRPPRNK
ncbi:MAG: ZmpA/ZmpB/ZmpC family metallo-endopeptidase-related protein, partial [Bacteriovoracaceae bacterium]